MLNHSIFLKFTVVIHCKRNKCWELMYETSHPCISVSLTFQIPTPMPTKKLISEDRGLVELEVKLPVNKSRFCQWLMFSICLIKDFKVLRAPVGKLEFTPNLICHLWKFRLLGHLWLCALPLELFLPLTCLELGTKTSLSQYQVLMCKKLVLWFYCLHHYVVSHCALSQRLGGY